MYLAKGRHYSFTEAELRPSRATKYDRDGPVMSVYIQTKAGNVTL